MERNRSGNGNRYEGLNEYTQKQIRIVAVRVARSYGFKQHEQLDIEQELVMHLRSKLPTYDANRASVRTFVERVLEHKAIDLITERRARKRGACVTTLSLDDLDEDGTSGIQSNALLDPATIALEDFLIVERRRNLDGGALSHADSDAMMAEADLGPADIRGPDGKKTGQTWPANLSDADLSGADLSRVNLGSVELDGANTAGAILPG